MGALLKRHIAPIVLILSMVCHANAGGIVAGELSYTCTNPAIQAYRFDLIVYSDCQSTGSLPQNILMDYQSSCLSGDLNLALIDSSIEIEPCNSGMSCCQSPGPGCMNAVRSFHYRGSINNLPACSDWDFNAMVCCRSQSLTNSISPGNHEIFLESSLDNTLPLSNSNPNFNSIPIIQSCDGEVQNWSMLASDPDGDSLSFELVPPQSFGPGVPIAVPYTPGYSHTNPIDVSANFTLNGQSGNLSFEPVGQQASVTSIRITEYRNGLAISQSVRDVFVWVINCSNQAPGIVSIQPISGADLIDSNRLGLCPNLAAQVDFIFGDPDFDSVFIEEQINSQIPGATTALTPTGFSLSWQPGPADTGLHSFDFTLSDNGCDYPRSKAFRFFIQVGNVLDAGPDTATYCGQSVVLHPNLGSSWSWSPSIGLSSDTIKNPLANPAQPTFYILSNACGTDSLFVDLRGPDFQVEVGPDKAICSGIFDSLAVQIQPLAPIYQVNWNGNISGQSSDLAVIGPADAGLVIAEVSDGRGCTVRDSLNITRSSTQWNIQTSFSQPRCALSNDGAVWLNTSGGLPPYAYRNGLAPWTDSSRFNGLGGGSYLFRVSDSAGCDTSFRVQLQAPAPLSLSNLQVDSVDCFGGNSGLIQTMATGGVGAYRYALDQSGFQASGTFTQLPAGSYTLLYRDGNGCVDSTGVNISQPDSLQIQILGIDSASCRNDGRLLLDVVGGSPGYQSLLGGQAFVPGQWLDSLSAGSYAVFVRDSKGCSDSLGLVIPSADSLALSVQINDAICFGASNGSANLTVSGGLAPFQYSLDGGPLQAQNSFSNLPSGTYQFSVVDDRQCSRSVSATIDEPSPVQVSSIPTDALCHGKAVGSVQISASGGQPSYTYQIFAGGDTITSGSGNISSLPAGSYTIIVRDQHGCEGFDSTGISEPPASSYQIFTDSASCYGTADGSLQVIALPPMGFDNKLPFNYSINGSGFESGNFWAGLPAGNFEIVIRDRDGCLDTLNQALFSLPKISVAVIPKEVSIPLGRQFLPEIQLNGFSSAGYALQWSPSNGLSCDQCQSPLVTVSEDAVFTITATDWETGCETADTLRVLIREPNPVFVPNMFTPNNDGINDVLFLYGNDILEVSMVIFNRWGEKVFFSNSPFDGWDGSFKGAPAKNGVYHYQLSGSYLSGETFEFSGNVALVR